MNRKLYIRLLEDKILELERELRVVGRSQAHQAETIDTLRLELSAEMDARQRLSDLRESNATLEQIKGILWLDLDEHGNDWWNPDKEWSSGADFLQAIADVMADYRPAGLPPADPRLLGGKDDGYNHLRESADA